MAKILVYSFYNFPYEIKVDPIFRFRKLSKDIELFKKQINLHKPDLIIGIAKSSNNISRFETQTVNMFNNTKQIDKSGKDGYKLSFPQHGFRSIGLHIDSTDSFCNWTMYKISQLIEGSKTKLQFIHVSKAGIIDLNNYLEIV